MWKICYVISALATFYLQSFGIRFMIDPNLRDSFWFLLTISFINCFGIADVVGTVCWGQNYVYCAAYLFVVLAIKFISDIMEK